MTTESKSESKPVDTKTAPAEPVKSAAPQNDTNDKNINDPDHVKMRYTGKNEIFHTLSGKSFAKGTAHTMTLDEASNLRASVAEVEEV